MDESPGVYWTKQVRQLGYKTSKVFTVKRCTDRKIHPVKLIRLTYIGNLLEFYTKKRKNHFSQLLVFFQIFSEKYYLSRNFQKTTKSLFRPGIEPGVSARRRAVLSTQVKIPRCNCCFFQSIIRKKLQFIITNIFQAIEFDWINISVRESGSVFPDSNSYLGTRDLS